MLKKISESLYDHLGKISQVRIQSYIILAEIILTGLVYLGLEITNAIINFRAGKPFEPSTEGIIIYGMILSHHLVMLGLKKSSESSSYPSLDKKIEAQSGSKSSKKEEDLSDDSLPSINPNKI